MDPAALGLTQRPAFVPQAEPGQTPFADSFTAPRLNRPVELPPETVEATRLGPVAGPPQPVVEGVWTRTGEAGSGAFNQPRSLTPVSFRRDAPMSIADGVRAGLFESRVPGNVMMSPEDAGRAGLIDVYNGGVPPKPNFSNFHRGAFNPMEGVANAGQEMGSEDAAAMRTGFRASSAAGRDKATARAAGATGRAKDIVARILGETAESAASGRRMTEEDAASGRRMQEARVTPQVRDGVAYDPLTGASAEVQRGGTVRPTKWSEYTPKELGDMVNDAVKSMMPEGDSAAFKTALLTATSDADKQAVYAKFSARPTPAQQLIMDTAMGELQSRGGAKPAGGASAQPEGEKQYSQEDAKALPKGTLYLGSDGKRHKRI